ncbi:MAG: hypothetical protein F6J90_27455 [Moorea sp. SIOASIH]|nr:hypothetical protein [Moorena sp. SIOASIH]
MRCTLFSLFSLPCSLFPAARKGGGQKARAERDPQFYCPIKKDLLSLHLKYQGCISYL